MRIEGAPHPRGKATIREEIVQGVTYATRTPHITLVLGLLLFVSLFVINFNVIVPLFARDVLGLGAHGFGLLMAALGVGAMFGALGVASLSLRRPSTTVVIIAAAAASVGLLGLSFVRSFALAAAGPGPPCTRTPSYTGIPKSALAAMPIAYVTPTAKAMMTRLMPMRRRTSMPERKATRLETRMIVVPAVTIVGHMPRAPKSTGKTGITAPAK